jgi:hypothetical protein
MSVYVNNSGTWTLAKEVYVNQAGTWKEPQEIYINDAGTWKVIHKVVYIASNTANIDLFTYVGSPSTALRLKVVVNSGVNVYSDTPGTPSLAISGFATGSQILLINNGNIQGAGGTGGRGEDYGIGNTGAGGQGGTALSTTLPITVQNNGTIYAGGGGGGGSVGLVQGFGSGKGYYTQSVAGSGGGGGAGIVGGTGGAAGGNATWPGGAGNAGTSGAGGAGGSASYSTTGGAGGGIGSPGADSSAGGGSAGYYIVGNSNVTWETLGTVSGLVG